MRDCWPDSRGLSQGQVSSVAPSWVESQVARVLPWVSLSVVPVRARVRLRSEPQGAESKLSTAVPSGCWRVCLRVQPWIPVTRGSLPPTDAASSPYHGCVRSTRHAPAPDGVCGPAAPGLGDRPHAANHPRTQDQRGTHASFGPSHHGASPTTHDCADRSVSHVAFQATGSVLQAKP